MDDDVFFGECLDGVCFLCVCDVGGLGDVVVVQFVYLVQEYCFFFGVVVGGYWIWVVFSWDFGVVGVGGIEGDIFEIGVGGGCGECESVFGDEVGGVVSDCEFYFFVEGGFYYIGVDDFVIGIGDFEGVEVGCGFDEDDFVIVIFDF